MRTLSPRIWLWNNCTSTQAERILHQAQHKENLRTSRRLKNSENYEKFWRTISQSARTSMKWIEDICVVKHPWGWRRLCPKVAAGKMVKLNQQCWIYRGFKKIIYRLMIHGWFPKMCECVLQQCEASMECHRRFHNFQTLVYCIVICKTFPHHKYWSWNTLHHKLTGKRTFSWVSYSLHHI